jgi:hypothetical protein
VNEAKFELLNIIEIARQTSQVSSTNQVPIPVPEIIDQVFTKTSPKRSFCMTKNERFGLVFTKTGSINSGTVQF